MHSINSIQVPQRSGNGHKYNQSPNGSPFSNSFYKNGSSTLSDTEEL